MYFLFLPWCVLVVKVYYLQHFSRCFFDNSRGGDDFVSSTNIFGITIVSFSVCEVSTKTFLKQNCVSVVEYFVGSCMGFVKIFNMDNFCNSFGKLTFDRGFHGFTPSIRRVIFQLNSNRWCSLSLVSKFNSIERKFTINQPIVVCKHSESVALLIVGWYYLNNVY